MKQIYTTAQFVGFKFVVVSLFSGMGGLDEGLRRSGMTIGYANDANFYACLLHGARFKHGDGTPVITPFIEIDEDTYKFLHSDKDTEDYCGIIGHKYYRTKLVQEITGKEIRAIIEQRYGKEVIIVLAGGPSCQEMTNMSKKARQGKTNPTGKNSKHLVLEFSRIVVELQADAIILEEVDELKQAKNKDVYDAMMKELTALPYNIVEAEPFSCHYGGGQIRKRYFMLMLHQKYRTMPLFPVADATSAKRVKDVLPYVAYFSSEQFTDKIKTSNYVLCTITRGTPAYFWDKKGRKWKPTVRELMKFVGFDDDYIIPEGIPESQVRLAIGNTVCTYLAEAIGGTLIKTITDTLSSSCGQVPPDDPDGSNSPAGDILNHTDVSGEGEDAKHPAAGPKSIPDEGTDYNSKDEHSLQEDVRLVELPRAMGSDTDAVGSVKTDNTLPILLHHPDDDNDHAHQEPRVEVIYDGSKIISSVDLLRMDFEVLPFVGEWCDFLGMPSSSFHMAVFGRAGQGKSTFCIQIANFLAENFGDTVYVSGEEGFSLTFQKKFVDYVAASQHLDVADIRSYHELVRNINPSRYRFILLDSLDTLKISVEQLRELKLMYKDSAFITISQVTKSGNARGSYQVMHDADIIVEVTEGVAVTIKNRFLATGMAYRVF
jgi:site-specific DNA-cytosine methylase